MDKQVLATALESDFTDFEDAVLHESGRRREADALTTRNVRDYQSASIPIYTPTAMLAELDAG